MVPVLATSTRLQTDTGTPAPPALGLVTTCSVPVTPADPDAVIGGRVSRSSLSLGYWPTVCTRVLLAPSPGSLATLTKVTIAVLVDAGPALPLPQGMPPTPGASACSAKQMTGATP